MSVPLHSFSVRLAQNSRDLRLAQRLRYSVFVQELGADGALVNHAENLEQDRFDALVDHMLVIDDARGPNAIVGVYRLMRRDHAHKAGQFYTESEYDLSPLIASGRPLLELGRSCLHPEYRGGTAMMHLWRGLDAYVRDHRIELLFGVASFHGTDVAALSQPLSHLYHAHRAPKPLRVTSRVPQRMDLLPEGQVDRRRAVLKMPALIKAYLRLGAVVGDGAYVDHGFNTTDVCMVMDTARMTARHRNMLAATAPA